MGTEALQNAILIQGVTLEDLERMIDRAIKVRTEAFYESIRTKPEVLIKRKEAARLLGVSLPTLDAYGRVGILHLKHVGGRVFYTQSEIEKYKQNNK